MNIDEVIKEYDSMFGVKPPREILSYLMQKIDMSREERDIASEIILLNETIGFCRDASIVEEGVRYAKELEHLMQELDFSGRIEYATTMLNLANAYRGFGMHADSEKRYAICEELYGRMLPEGDFLFASLYNNRGLLYQEMKDWDRAVEEFQNALKIADAHPQHEIEQATTRANLAAALIEASPEGRAAAEDWLQEAIDIFEKDGGKDFHYSAALSALGALYFHKKDYLGAAECFRKAMKQLYEGTGASEAYQRVKENYELSMQMAGVEKETAPDEEPAVARSRAFYEDYLKPLIEAVCPEAMNYIAAGYAGEGSEHFGFDDDYSRDHDFADGCCIWIPAVQAPVFGVALQDMYRAAYVKCFGTEPDLSMLRQGVLEIDDYFERLTGIGQITMRYYAKGISDHLYLMDDEQLAGIAAAVHGELFFDGEGTMTKLRSYFLEEMPEEFRRRKLATLTHLFSQAGQYNYLRSMRRADYVTARMYEARAMQTMLQIVFYLNKKYPPYLKLLRRGVAGLPLLPEVGDIAEAIADMPDGRNSVMQNGTDDKALSFDIVASLILDTMVQQGLIADYDKKEPFADRYIAEIAGLIDRKNKETQAPEAKKQETKEPPAEAEESGDTQTQLVEAIIKAEWEQFDKTKNEGGRADCQDNWNTFSIMRRSQYLTWPEELLASFYTDLKAAEATGRNLITEKYGRMMASTAPERYEEIKQYFPELSEERIKIQEEIIAIQVNWMESFAKQYPKMAGNARVIHTAEDTPNETSYETYLRGEIGTYSDATLLLYGRFIALLAQEGKNLAYETMNNTAQLLGYRDVADAESKL